MNGKGSPNEVNRLKYSYSIYLYVIEDISDKLELLFLLKNDKQNSVQIISTTLNLYNFLSIWPVYEQITRFIAMSDPNLQ